MPNKNQMKKDQLQDQRSFFGYGNQLDLQNSKFAMNRPLKGLEITKINVHPIGFFREVLTPEHIDSTGKKLHIDYRADLVGKDTK